MSDSVNDEWVLVKISTRLHGLNLLSSFVSLLEPTLPHILRNRCMYMVFVYLFLKVLLKRCFKSIYSIELCELYHDKCFDYSHSIKMGVGQCCMTGLLGVFLDIFVHHSGFMKLTDIT